MEVNNGPAPKKNDINICTVYVYVKKKLHHLSSAAIFQTSMIMGKKVYLAGGF